MPPPAFPLPFVDERGQHRVADERHVIVASARVFGGKGVQTEERRAHVDAQHVPDAPRHAQHATFGIGLEPVARFDLQRGDAVGEQGAGPRERLLQQVVFAGGTRGAHAGDDAATGAGDLLVAGAFQALLELTRPVSTEDEVRVAIDEAGCDPCARRRCHVPRQRIR